MVYIIYYNGLLRDVPATARPTNPVTRAYLCVGKKRERTERRGKGRKEGSTGGRGQNGGVKEGRKEVKEEEDRTEGERKEGRK